MMSYHIQLGKNVLITRYNQFHELIQPDSIRPLDLDIDDAVFRDAERIRDKTNPPELFQSIGLQLFDKLFSGEDRATFISDWQDCVNHENQLRVLLECNYETHPHHASLPWEFMLFKPVHGREVRLAVDPNIILIRYMPPVQDFQLNKRQIQLLVASPKAGDGTYAPINIDSLQDKLGDLSDEGHIALSPIVNYLDFEKLEKASKRDSDILHLVSHGEANPPKIVLVNSAGFPSPQDAQLIADTLNQSSAQLVVLHMCEGATSNSQYDNIAQIFIALGIPIVIAMQYPIKAFVANTFAETFYESLMKLNQNVEVAFQTARAALRYYDGYISRNFATPVFYSHVWRSPIANVELPFELDDAVASFPFILNLQVVSPIQKVDADVYRFRAKLARYTGDATSIRMQVQEAMQLLSDDDIQYICTILEYPCKLWRGRKSSWQSLRQPILEHSMTHHKLYELEQVISQYNPLAASKFPNREEKELTVTLSSIMQDDMVEAMHYKQWHFYLAEDV